MKYNLKKFNSAIEDYKKKLGNIRGKTFLITFDPDNRNAYRSFAPFSAAVHELGGDMHVMGFRGKSPILESLENVWDLHEKKDETLEKFISIVDKKAKGEFKKLFRRPEIRLCAGKNSFEGSIKLPYHAEWFREYKRERLIKTADAVWKGVYALKKERVGVGFVLIPKRKLLELPLEDYLDSYAVADAMKESAEKKAIEVTLNASSPRMSQMDFPERISDLKAALIGCELDKVIDEEPFVTFRKLSGMLNTDRIKISSANFFVSAKGYGGRHIFGQTIGYPTLNRKSRWNSPSGIIYKFDFYPQTVLEDRNPMSRVGFTETLPIDVFIETNLIDWDELTRKDRVLIDICHRCEKIIVEGEMQKCGYRTKIEVGLIMPNGKHRWARGSDTELRNLIQQSYLRRTGIRAGSMGNIPGGEMFVTPEYVEGTVVGDVVIAIDQSYMLSEKEPFVIKSAKNGYRVIRAPKKILGKFNSRKSEAWKLIEIQEKNKSVPKEVVEMKKKFFNHIGEFAINTNPKAKICDYLIVNEKIAGMMHVAMGSGYEPDRATEYHIDVVVDSIRQKHDIYGVDKSGKKHWIKKRGKFVI
ncbi:hypothetical protein HY638_04810 [Candidatus Woesearchaeota archaeon]|nr:hypothetical protein [Candidatus Woesearchaeota archaeon]